jgi:homocysteine S-methyltransferase
LATELEARGHDLSDALWSARVLADSPESVREAHRAYFRAGAVFATTASYQASFEGFAERGIGRAEAEQLMQRSVELARQAREEFADDGVPRWVAASVGPFGAALADGSEYRGRYGMTRTALRAWHRPRLEVLAAAEPDLLALETIPDVDEAEALVSTLSGTGVQAWLTYTVAGGRTRAGQSLTAAFELAAETPEVVAVGVNCCAPSEVPDALALAAEITGKPAVVYPNSGESWDPDRGWNGPVPYSADRAQEWVAAGARIVGGCCRVGPAEIAALSEELRS